MDKWVNTQCVENYYDLEANLAVLKLYQFNPTTIKRSTVERILLKALTALPNTDFVLCKCLIDSALLEDESIKSILALHNLLETCKFEHFWVSLP